MDSRRQQGITEHVEWFLKWFGTITQEESDFIEEILNWEDERRAAFLLAKRIFEGE